MFDSTNPGAIPATAAMVAGYVDGIFAWSPSAWARFPNAVKVRIAVRATTNNGHVLDVERGDASPAEAPPWVSMRRAAGVDPSIYCNVSTWPDVIAAFNHAGVPQPHYWVAHYRAGAAIPAIPAGSVAIQYADPPDGSGGQWDISAVADFWPGVDQGGPVTDPVNANVLAFVATGGVSTRASNMTDLAAGGVDPTSILGRVADIQWALTAALPKLLTAANQMAALAASISAVDTDVRAGTTALTAAIHAVSAGEPVDVPTLATALAGPLATALGPILPPEVTPAQMFTALAAQLAK